MALVACPECGHHISSLARFCPKCKQSKNNAAQAPPLPAYSFPSAGDILGRVVSPDIMHSSDDTTNQEFLQLEFKPSLDEMILLEGRTYLVKSTLSVSDCYAYLTSKRYALCDSSGVHIVFQIGLNGIASVTEGRHLISKKIIITTVSGEIYQVKSQPHDTWFSVLLDPQGAVATSRKPKAEPLSDSSGALEWYYKVNGISIGPVQEKYIIQFIQNNHTIYRDTSVWNACLTDWKRAEETILGFYFSDSAPFGADAPHAHELDSRSGLNLFSRVRRLFKRYL